MTTICKIYLNSDEPSWHDGMAVIQTLQKSGHRAYFVGGCVRDSLLQVPVHDVDITTSASPEQIAVLFPRHVDVGSRFGVMVVIIDAGRHIEVASLRSDEIYIDGRRPQGVNLETVDEQDDVQRRDFTINALLYEPLEGTIIDYVGGLEDLENRVLRVVGTPEARLKEDRLRILRGVRFAARFNLEIESATWKALASVSIEGISRERIIDEWVKSFSHRSRGYWWDLLVASGHVTDVCSSVISNRNLEKQLKALDENGAIDCFAALGLCWQCVPASQRQQLLQAEPLSRRLRNDILFLAAHLEQGPPDSDHQQRLIVEHQACASLFRAWQVQGLSQGIMDVWISRWQQWSAAVPLLGAKDLLDLGFRPGPLIGTVLRTVADAHCAGKVTTRSEALALVDKRYPRP